MSKRLTRQGRGFITLLVLALGLMGLAACGDSPAPAATATLVPPTATVIPATATAIPATATAIPPTATVAPPTATPVPDAAPAPQGDGQIHLSADSVKNFNKDVPVGAVTMVQLAADDRDPSTLLKAYLAELDTLGWQHVRVGGTLDIGHADNAYLSFLTKDGVDLVLRAQDLASFSLPDSPVAPTDVDPTNTILTGHKTILFIASGKGFAQAMVNALHITDSPTPGPADAALDALSGPGVQLSVQSVKAIQTGFGVSGQFTQAEVFASDTAPQAFMEAAIVGFKKNGWQVVSLLGQDYLYDSGHGLVLFTKSDVDFALNVSLTDSVNTTTLAQFTTADQAAVSQLATGKKTLVLAVSGTDFAQEIAQKTNAAAAPTVTPSASANGVAMSPETMKSLQTELGVPGSTVRMMQAFADTNDMKTDMEDTISALQKEGWQVLPIKGKPYTLNSTIGAAFLTKSGQDIVVFVYPASDVATRTRDFSAADKAAVQQLVQGKKTLAIAASGTGFAAATVKQLNAGS